MITKQVSPVAYHLALPPTWTIHDIFHTSFVTGSWDKASSYALWTGVSSGTGLVLYGLIGSRGLS